MPTADRRTRTRLRSRGTTDIESMEQLRGALADAHGDADKWREARPRVVRFLAQRVKDGQTALEIAEAYHKRPDFMPMLPPHNTSNGAH
ncbi:MAG: hypothetical protein ABIR55_03890 [Burkholderiaceae bacterium]